MEINAQLSVVAICKGRLYTGYPSMVCQVHGELVQAGGFKSATFRVCRARNSVLQVCKQTNTLSRQFKSCSMRELLSPSMRKEVNDALILFFIRKGRLYTGYAFTVCQFDGKQVEKNSATVAKGAEG